MIRLGTEPSKTEVEEHYLDHAVFREWCPHCVKGRGQGKGHKVQQGSAEKDIPTISIDYMFMQEGSDKEERLLVPD